MKRITSFLAALFLSVSALASGYIGDYAPSTVVYGKFTTYTPSTGATGTLGGTPALSVYKDNSTTQSTSGVTLTADFDSVTGLNHFAIDTSTDGTFYSAGSNFDVVITTGTVGGVSVTGSVVGSFSINKVAALRPATAGRTLVVDASGLADANTVKIGPTGSGTAQTARDIGASVLLSSGTGTGQLSLSSGTVTAGTVGSGAISEASYATTAGSFKPLGIIDQGTAQAYTAGTPSLTLRSAAAFGDNTLTGVTAMICGSTQGYCQSATIASNVGSTDVATLYAALPVAASGTVTYYLFGTASGGTSLAAQLLSTDISSYMTADTWGNALNSASSAGDPWATSLPGAYSSGTAGYIIGTNLNAAITSRMATYTQPTGFLAATFPATFNNLSAAQVNAEVDTAISDAALATAANLALTAAVADAIKVVTDKFVFGVANQVNVNVESINTSTVVGAGTSGDLWRGQ